MSRRTSELKEAINQALSVELVNIAGENQGLLVTMLYGSDPLETTKFFHVFAEGTLQLNAAKLCLALHKNKQLRDEALANNFFSNNLKAMLNIALANPIYGARMMPIFCNFATYADDHNFDETLKGALLEVMEHLRSTLGFAIKEISEDTVVLIPADDVRIG